MQRSENVRHPELKVLHSSAGRSRYRHHELKVLHSSAGRSRRVYPHQGFVSVQPDAMFHLRSVTFNSIIFALLLMALTLLPSGTLNAQNISSFYAIADSFARYPRLNDTLVLLGSTKVDKWNVTFIGYKSVDEVILAAVTANPIKNIRKEISLLVDFEGISPRAGTVTTWGYLYDRNADGKIDYMALLGGAAPVWKDDVPKNFPTELKSLTNEQMEIFVSHCALVFNHWADDNFDGELDGAVQIDMDPKREWVKRHLLVSSTKFNSVYDDITAFSEQLGDLPGDTIEVNESGGVPYHPIGEKIAELNKKTFQEKSNTLWLFNEAVKKCSLSKKLKGVPKNDEDE